MKCAHCGKVLGVRNVSGYCKDCQGYRYYHLHAEELKAVAVQWRKDNPERAKELGREYHWRNREARIAKSRERYRKVGPAERREWRRNLLGRWHGHTLLHFYPSRTRGQIGEAIAERWLNRLGFTDVERLTKFYDHFPFDFVATYEGKRVFVDASTDLTKKVGKRKKVADLLGLRFFVIHVSLDGVHYQLNEITFRPRSNVTKKAVDQLLGENHAT